MYQGVALESHAYYKAAIRPMPQWYLFITDYLGGHILLTIVGVILASTGGLPII